jgi:hypothetical protein
VKPVEERDLLGDGQRRHVVEEQRPRPLLRQLQNTWQLAAVERTHAKVPKLREHGAGASVDAVNQKVGPTFT